MRTFCSVSTVSLTALGVACFGATIQATAQVVEPVPVDLDQPEPPTTRMGTPLEGWVIARYSVRADGSTDDVVLVDKMPPTLAHRPAIAAIESWRFEPATVDGELVDWHNNEALILFQSDEVPETPSAAFAQSYQAAQALSDEGDQEAALRANERMLESATRLIEIGLAQVQAANFYLRSGDAHAAFAAISRATDPRIPTVQGDDLNIALQYRNALEVQLGDLLGAIETFERRNAIAPVPGDDLVAANIAGIEKALSEGGTIVHKVRILDADWRHDLDRRTFAISTTAGEVEAIRVDCDRRRTELEYSAEAEWTLPESWGACSVAVEGRDNTEFDFYEFQ